MHQQIYAMNGHEQARSSLTTSCPCYTAKGFFPELDFSSILQESSTGHCQLTNSLAARPQGGQRARTTCLACGGKGGWPRCDKTLTQMYMSQGQHRSRWH